MSELTDSQITKLNKPDLVILVKKLQADNASLKEDILEKLATITSTVQELKASNEVLHSHVSIQNTVNDKLMKRVVTLERELHLTEQYSRRNCIEIVGIPESVSDNDLEMKTCEILEAIGVNIEADNIEACHRLKKKNRTIVKVVNRKVITDILFKRKN